MKTLYLWILNLLILSSNPGWTQETYIRINAVGDVMPATSYPVLIEPPEKEQTYLNLLGNWLKKGNPDFVFGNLEGPLTYHNKTNKDPSKPNTFVFRIPPQYARTLRLLGFNVMSVANNHALDFKLEGHEETKKFLREENITPLGDKNKAEFFNVKGIKVAWIAFAWNNFFNSILKIEESMNLIKEVSEKSDILILSVHGGSEGDKALKVRDEMEYLGEEKRGNLVKFSHLAIDHGADLILIHGPHVPRAMELYKNKLIAYSLGNFITYKSFATSGYQKYAYILQVDLDPEGNFIKGKIFPFVQDENGPYKGIPRYDDNKSVIKLLKKLTQEDFPNTPLLITNEGDISRNSTLFK